jgi:serine/threonine protein phosphatase PrpC
MIHSKVIQLCKEQDELLQGEAIDTKTGETYSYGIIADGHGQNRGVQDIRTILQTHLATILEAEDPHIVIQDQLLVLKQQQLDNVKPTLFGCASKTRIIFELSQSGSTFIRVKVYANRVECFSIGDSEVYVLKNGEIAYHNPIHNWENEDERYRLLNRSDICVSAKPTYRYDLINTNTIVCVPSSQIVYTHNHLFVPSQALGHDGITEFAPERYTVYYESSDQIKVVMASDGLWDVFTPSHPDDYACLQNLNGEQLADLAELRWKQTWNMLKTHDDTDPPQPASFEVYDDVSVITICSSNYSGNQIDN